MIFITSETELKLNKGIHCLYFYSSLVCVHKEIVSIISDFEKEQSRIFFKAIDINHFETITKRFRLSCLPTIIFYNEGRSISKIEGLLIPVTLKQTLLDILK